LLSNDLKDGHGMFQGITMERLGKLQTACSQANMWIMCNKFTSITVTTTHMIQSFLLLYTRSAQILGARSLWQLIYVQWHLIWGSSVWSLLYVTFQAPITLSWLLYFWKIKVLVIYTANTVKIASLQMSHTFLD